MGQGGQNHRRALFALTLTLLILAPASTAAMPRSADHHNPTCGPADAKTLLADRRARVYTVSRTDRLGHREFEVPLALACLSPHGRPRLLASTGSGLAVYRHKQIGALDSKTLALHAPWVAYAKTISGIDTWSLSVVATNLRTHANRFCLVGGTRVPEQGPSVASIALERNGAVAWSGIRRVATPPPTGGPQYFPPGTTAPPEPPFIAYSFQKQVVACLADEEEVLDTGPTIDLHSLALHGSILTWTDSGETHTATLH